MNRTRTRKVFLKTLSLFITPLPFIGALLLIVYPNYNDIVLAKESFDPQGKTRSVTLHLFTTLAPSKALVDYEADFDNSNSLEYVSPEVLARFQNSGTVAQRLEPISTTLNIESARINAPIRDGEDAFAMERGPWHFPLSVRPGEKGNMVVIGHRFAELPPSTNTFFNLDKIKIGDKITITQQGGIEYTYTVTETKVVEKNDRSILADHNDHRITLVTCTPLWTSKQRLVVVGQLDKAYRNI
ncbi:class D sortase [Candidatus Nomurabacteria bacterium]|uniref:Class D sortase n=1 Tax=Candidatus Dojkabacteria bacterium TaxID=2099670 RepID=A0A955I1S0_9BACT|nr:class D sortase [Candidatus Dojkabacteria bacterium]MCB9789888.1 class D sortase [Candidatus Nomurabacteria bacterium]MCB9803489.1 class D sortase [Candidatus Nomurabacteria bacterium]